MEEKLNLDKYNLKYPVREFFLEDELGNIIGDLSLISFVKQPAHHTDWKMFSLQNFIFSMQNVEKKLIYGPAMRVNFPILQQDKKTGEYFYAVFSEEQVKKCSEIYLKNSNHTKTNLEHGKLLKTNEIDGVEVVESWTVEDPNCDKALSLGFAELNKGDWYVSYKVENDKFWDMLKQFGGGFSIEGRFAERFLTFSREFSDEEIVNKITEIVCSQDISNIEKEKQIKIFLKNDN